MLLDQPLKANMVKLVLMELEPNYSSNQDCFLSDFYQTDMKG